MAKQIIIIGAGHNGLVCSCYLARKGFDVTLLEQRPIVGGAAVTEEFHPGFRNSTASYTVSLLHPNIISDLHLKDHGLRFLQRRINNYLPLADGDYFALSSDENFNHRQLSRFSKHDPENLQTYNRDLGQIVSIVKTLMLQTPPKLHEGGISDIWKAFQLSREFRHLDRRHKQLMVKLFSRSAAELLDEYFESDAIKAVLGFDAIVGHYDSPYSPGSAYVLLHHLLGEVDGKQGAWGHAVGGMGAITQAMAAEAESLGIKIVTDTRVEAITLSKGLACGVHTENRLFPADLVVSNINPKLLFLNLLDESQITDEISAHFQQYKCQSGTFRMNLALSALPQFTGMPEAQMLEAGIIMAPSLDYMDQAYIDARRHGWSKAPIVEMLIPSIVDDSLAPTGRHVASLFCQQFDPELSDLWQEKRGAAAADIINTVDQFAPGFRELVMASQIHSPYDLEQKFGLVGGDIFHGRLSLEQLFSMRPMLGMGQYQTHIKNLYMCGAGTHPGGGVSGLPGYNAAREILRQN